MGFNIFAGLKGVADGINAEAAIAQQYKLALAQSTGQTRANLAINAKADILKRTVSLGNVPWLDPEDNQVKTHNITYVKSDAGDVNTRNIENISSIINATTQNLGGRSVMEWIDANGDMSLANNVVNEYGQWMHPIILNSKIDAQDGSFKLQKNFPFINDPYWQHITKRMVTHGSPATVLPGDFRHTYNMVENDDGTVIFPQATTNMDELTRSYWNPEDPLQKPHYVSPEDAFNSTVELAQAWNRSLEKPYTDNQELLDAFLFTAPNGMGNDKSTLPRSVAITIARDLRKILKGGYAQAMGSTQKRKALMGYLRNLAENHNIYVNDPVQLAEIFSYSFTNTWQDGNMPNHEGFVSFNDVAKNHMGINKPENLRKATEAVAKPIQRIDRLLDLAGPSGDEGSLPMGLIRQVSLFGRGFTEIGDQARTGLDSILGAAKDGAMAVINSTQFLWTTENGKDDALEEITRLEKNVTKNMNTFQGLIKLYGSEAELSRAYDRGDLDSAQMAIVDGTMNALVEFHGYLLAFEVAGAIQGGGDSRTISDKDVRIMRAALRDKWLSSGRDFIGVIRELRRELQGSLNVNRLWTNALRTGQIKDLKAASLYEALYLDMADGENPLRAFARKWTKKTSEELLQEHGDAFTEGEDTGGPESITDVEIPEIPFGPPVGDRANTYMNLNEFSNVVNQVENLDESSPLFTQFRTMATQAAEAGYTKDHFIAVFGNDLADMLYPQQ